MRSLNLKHRAYLVQKSAQHLLMRNIIPLNRAERMALESGPKIFANSIPKSGTHLLRHILAMMPGIIDRWTYHYAENIVPYKKQLRCAKKGQIISAHMPWENGLGDYLEEVGLKNFLMVRDIRDICVSSAHYCSKDKRHRLYTYFNSLDSWSDRLSAVINGIDASKLADGIRSKSIVEHLDAFMPWLDDPQCLIIRFEDLVGEKGGGTVDRQLKTINQIAKHIDIALSDCNIIDIMQNSFTSKTKTFRKGQIGGWKDEFDSKNIELIKRVAGKQLIKLGYEKNYE